MASQMGNRDESPVPLRYIRSVRELVRNHLRFFLWATIAAVALRLLFIFRFPALLTDSFVYGDIAKNWLQHGIYGLSDAVALGAKPGIFLWLELGAVIALVWTSDEVGQGAHQPRGPALGQIIGAGLFVVASVLAAAILREKLTPRLFFGAALISAGVVLVSLS